MTLLYSDVEEELRASVRQLLADRSPWRAVLARAESDQPYDRALWRALAAGVGCAGLAIPEKWGGAGASWREVAVVLEELGRAAAPVPFLGSALATAALLANGETEAQTELLAALAAGDRTAVLVIPLSTPPAAPVPVSVRAGGTALTGTVTSVADALPAAWAAVKTTGAALLASEQLGVAEWCLDTTVEYLKTRHQFGRPVGQFRALKHRLAELWVTITQARALARYAAGCLADDDPDTPVAASLAQAHCSQVGVRAAEECVQMHGGIGFTWEHPAHLYLKRAKSAAIALGTPERHRAALAELVDLPPAATGAASAL